MSRERERRRWVRVEPAPGGPAAHARLRVGGDLRVRDISSGGARVEGPSRLLPGVHLDLHLVGAAGRQLVRGRVVWARVRCVAPLAYEAAVCFDDRFDVFPGGYRIPDAVAALATPVETPYPPHEAARLDVGETTGKSRLWTAGRMLGSLGSEGDTRDEQPAAV